MFMLSLKKMSGTEPQTLAENVEVSILTITTAQQRIVYRTVSRSFSIHFLVLFLLFLDQVERHPFVKRRLKSLDTFRG